MKIEKEDLEYLKNELSKTVINKNYYSKDSITQDLDRRFDALTDKMTIAIQQSLVDFSEKKIDPLKIQIDDAANEIKFAKRLGYIFASIVMFATDFLGKVKALFN